ncbi:MAG: hypothetical protein GC146_15165 [Limimaricola sp.]|uniref:anti-sigma factor n=1 Tax=Limimaricola sp. TaxID=2211665 RepID=UPI001D35882E|nr:anti-sigma factor [Limimaricola sp.]MBI1418554.1 hypothetical protein [Limimaricola sp.]
MTDPTDLTGPEEAEALAAEYALGLLTPPEARAFEDLLAVDPSFREAYARWTEDFASLAETVPEVAPPRDLQARIEADLFPAAAPARQGWLQRLGLLPAMAAGLAAAVAVLVVLNLNILGPQAPSFVPGYRAEVAAADRSLIVAAAFDPASGALRIDRQAGAAPSGRVLQLWVIAGDQPPQSLGVLPDTAKTDITVPQALQAAVKDGTLAISEEPPGGSPTGLPTGAVLATGKVTAL